MISLVSLENDKWTKSYSDLFLRNVRDDRFTLRKPRLSSGKYTDWYKLYTLYIISICHVSKSDSKVINIYIHCSFYFDKIISNCHSIIPCKWQCLENVENRKKTFYQSFSYIEQCSTFFLPISRLKIFSYQF